MLANRDRRRSDDQGCCAGLHRPGDNWRTDIVGRAAAGCPRYIELNLVRADMVTAAAVYRWSSHAANAAGATDVLVRPHPLHLAAVPGPRCQPCQARLCRQSLCLRGTGGIVRTGSDKVDHFAMTTVHPAEWLTL